MGARACLHDGRQLLGISVNMVATEQRVLNSKLSVADIICQDAGAAKCVRAGWFGVGCDRDDPPLLREFLRTSSVDDMCAGMPGGHVSGS
jgi:hypothetical protein